MHSALLEGEKFTPLILQGSISLFCFNFTGQHDTKTSFSPHSQMRLKDLLKWWGKTTAYWGLKANVPFPLKTQPKIELHRSTAGLLGSLPSRGFTK